MAVTVKQVERGWTLVSIAGGALLGLWAGYGWITDQNDDISKMQMEVAPAVVELKKQTRGIRTTLQEIREDKRVAALAMEAQCEKPNGSDLPPSYCEQVLSEKRIREAREAERAGGGE